MRVLIEAVNTPTIFKFDGLTATLRIEAIEGFTTFNGQVIPPGNGSEQDFYLEVPITIANDEMLIPSFEIDSTEDAYPWHSPTTGDIEGYCANIVLSDGRKIPYLPKFKVPTLAAGDPSLAWNEIRIFNRSFRRRFTGLDRMISVNMAQEWIQAAVGALNRGSETNTGIVALTTDPVDPQFPIAVSANDPQWLAYEGSFNFLSAYASPAVAVTEIGATRVTLIVDESIAIPANLTFPSNITLWFIGAGMLVPATGVTVTIQGPILAPPVQIFSNAVAGQGSVRFTNSRGLSELYPQWWGAVGDDATDCTPAIQAAIDALDASDLSGVITFIEGVYRLAGVLQDVLNSNSQILLPRRSSASTSMISITLKGLGPAPTYAVKRNRGAVLKSVLVAGNGNVIGGKVSAGAWPVAGNSWCSVHLHNLTVRVQPNPTYSGVDLRYYPNSSVRNCLIGTDEDVITVASNPPVIGVTEPTTATSYGLKLPPGDLPDQAIVDNVEVYGFYNGILSGELANVDNTLIVFCKNGLEIPGALHAQKFGRIYISDCVRRVVFTGSASYVDIQQLSMEHNIATPAWAQHTADIYDPGNFGHGIIRWHLTTDGTVVNDLIQTGAFYLWTESLGNLENNHFSSPMVQAHNIVNQTIPNATFTNVTFNTNISDDPFDLHSVTLNTDRFVPAKEGIVQIEFGATFAASATGTRQVRIYKRSALGVDVLLKRQNFAAIAGVAKTIEASAMSRATLPGDYFYVQVWQDSGGALDLVSSTAEGALIIDSPLVFMKITR